MKPRFTKPPVQEVSTRMLQQGHTIRSWSAKNGFSYSTVRNLLNGQYRHRNTKVCMDIRAALIRDNLVELTI
jgi:gp16 family phage-associated protein